MFAIIALICFVLKAFGVNPFDEIDIGWLGLAFIAVEFIFPWRPWAGVSFNRSS